MPATRRSSGNNRNSTGRQSTLSFNHRVTKASVPVSAKKNLISTTPNKQSPLAKHVSTPTKEEDGVVEIEPPQSVEEEEEEEEIQQSELAPPAQPEVAEKSEAELRADQVTDRQVNQYWRALESERLAKRMHQEDLSLAEKVLRYWDVSSQYGPCVGISRKKRWQRADRLGLSPPIEVLAILLREEGKGNTKSIENAHMDDILNSTAIGGGES